jgi:hypothetical protein
MGWKNSLTREAMKRVVRVLTYVYNIQAMRDPCLHFVLLSMPTEERINKTLRILEITAKAIVCGNRPVG